jgi:hypothetical protein
MPLRVLLQLLPTLISIKWLEKGHGIRGVDEHRDTQISSLGPQRIQTGIIYRDEVVTAISVAQSQLLEDLEPTGSSPHLPLQLLCHALAEARGGVAEVGSGEIDHALTQRFPKGAHPLLEGDTKYL